MSSSQRQSRIYSGPAAYIIGSRYNVRAAAKQFGIYGARTYDSSKKGIREWVHIPVIAVNTATHPAHAEAMLEAGVPDPVGVACGILCVLQFSSKAERGNTAIFMILKSFLMAGPERSILYLAYIAVMMLL